MEPMPTQSDSLNSVLRCEMTATHQQFIHILALREWGEQETAARIAQVDNVDFPNAMRIIDYMVETGTPIDLAPDPFMPGTDYRRILISERTMERRLSAALERVACADGRAQALIAAARGPREAYSAWLAGRLDGEMPDHSGQSRFGAQTADVVAHLITLIEQSMVHAFIQWHGGDADSADAAWATSGAAMMRMTEFVRLFAAHRSVPVPGAFPALRIADQPHGALELERELAKLCANEAAAAAAGCDQGAIADLCRRIADYCLELSRWSPGRAHPASNTNPAAFSSFEATLTKFVRSD